MRSHPELGYIYCWLLGCLLVARELVDDVVIRPAICSMVRGFGLQDSNTPSMSQRRDSSTKVVWQRMFMPTLVVVLPLVAGDSDWGIHPIHSN